MLLEKEYFIMRNYPEYRLQKTDDILLNDSYELLQNVIYTIC